MYPVLETERLILKALKENDFDDMYKLYSDESVIATMESEVYSTPDKFKKIFTPSVSHHNVLTIRQKDGDIFTGFIGCHQFVDMKKREIKHSQMWTAISPGFWGKGFCTEATNKLLHFAFTGIKTPIIYANQLQINPAAGKVLRKCGFSYFRTLKWNNEPYDQYRYLREDYFNNNAPIEENTYDYSFPISKSPYSYDNPIRIIDGITYVKEPTGYLCGQSVIAMLANVSVDEVIAVMQNDKGTSVSEIDNALFYYGIKHDKKRTRATNETRLPAICILSLKLPGYGHWSLYYKGIYYDPEFGMANKLPENAILNHYWEVLN